MTTRRPPSMIERIFEQLLRNSRRTATIRRAPLKGGAELAVLVQAGTVTLTIKRKDQPVGDRELLTFRRDCNVPADAEQLTPPEQATRYVAVRVRRDDGSEAIEQETWRYVTWRWPDAEDKR
jgi:hypothetical protein